MLRKKLTIYIAIALLLTLFIALLGYTILKDQEKSSELSHRYQLQESFNKLLLAKETELTIPLRDFTPDEEDAMLRGELTPEEVIAAIVEECATPEPVLSGKTNEEVTKEFTEILDAHKKSFTAQIDTIIAEAQKDFKGLSSEDEKNDFLLEYVDRMSKMEEGYDYTFIDYMEKLDEAYTSVDGSLDKEDTAQMQAFRKEYEDEKTKQIARFGKEYNK